MNTEDKAELIDVVSNQVTILNSANFTIGRGNNNSFIIEDLMVSRTHCIFEKIDSTWYIRDKSSNGTFINDKMIQKDKPVQLNHGDVVTMSINSKFKFTHSKAFMLESDDDSLLAMVESPVTTTATTSKDNVVDFTGEYKGATSTSSIHIDADMERLESEFTCAICTELFVKAVTLNCSHTFCKHCIDQWREKQKICPICRAKIETAFPTIVVDNYIEKVLESASDETKRKRKEMIEQRNLELSKKLKVTIPVHNPIPIDVSSDELSDTDDDDDSLWEDFEEGYSLDNYDAYTGIPGAYYGGYGYCYSCGDSGHWANGCPNRLD